MRSFVLAALLAFTGADEGMCDEKLIPVGASRGWLVYATPDGRFLLESTIPGVIDPNVAQAIEDAIRQKAARDYIRKDSI